MQRRTYIDRFFLIPRMFRLAYPLVGKRKDTLPGVPSILVRFVYR